MATITKLITITGAIASDLTAAYAYPLDDGGDSSGTVIAASAAEILSGATKTKSYVVSVTCDDSTELVGPWIVGLGSIGGYEPFAEVPFAAGSDVYRASGGATELTGSNAITVTVQNSDDDEPIENAKVRFYVSGQSETKRTDVNGLTDAFGLDTATWNYLITKSGFASKSGTLAVSTDASVTYQLDPVSVTIPDDPTLATLIVKTLDEYGAPEVNVDVDVRLTKIPAGSTGIAFDGKKQTATSDVDGLAEFTAVRGATYQFKRGVSEVWTTAVIEEEASTTVKSFIGVDE